MGWARLDDGFYDHPKVLATSNAAIGLYCKALSYCGKHLTDGVIPAAVVTRILAGTDAEVNELVRNNLVFLEAETVRITNYLSYQPSSKSVKKERKRAKRGMRVLRARRAQGVTRNTGWDGMGKASSSLKKEKSTAHAKPEALLIDEINRIAGTKFRPVESNLRFGRGRLREYGFDELRAMLAWRWRTWGPDERRQWFRPETVLNETKCASYMGQYDATTPRASRPAPNPELERIAAREKELARG
jgi:hypothetical protein